MTNQILIVDDDQLLRRSLAFNLLRVGYQVQTVASAEEALAQIELSPPDVVLMDIGLPGMDGLEALRLLRNRLPIIFVSARQRHLDEVLGLELGAEDYITKPFEFDVLLARLRVVLRRQNQHTPVSTRPDLLVIGDMTIDTAAHEVTIVGKPLNLAPREFDLLWALAADVGHVVSTEKLLARVWGPEYEGEAQIIYVCIRALREKIESEPHRPQRLLTVRSVGYKLIPQENPHAQPPQPVNSKPYFTTRT
jgi:DNA-binding response OmpR family regulator